MLPVANFANTKLCKILENGLKPWHKDTHLRVLSGSYLMNTNMKGFRWLLGGVGCLGCDQVLTKTWRFFLGYFAPGLMFPRE